MLINNSLTGTALALNAMIDYLYTNKEQALSFLCFDLGLAGVQGWGPVSLKASVFHCHNSHPHFGLSW